MLRSPDQTTSRCFPYLVGFRESRLDLHHLLWSLLSEIAVMTVTCGGRKAEERAVESGLGRQGSCGVLELFYLPCRHDAFPKWIERGTGAGFPLVACQRQASPAAQRGRASLAKVAGNPVGPAHALLNLWRFNLKASRRPPVRPPVRTSPEPSRRYLDRPRHRDRRCQHYLRYPERSSSINVACRWLSCPAKIWHLPGGSGPSRCREGSARPFGFRAMIAGTHPRFPA